MSDSPPVETIAVLLAIGLFALAIAASSAIARAVMHLRWLPRPSFLACGGMAMIAIGSAILLPFLADQSFIVVKCGWEVEGANTLLELPFLFLLGDLALTLTLGFFSFNILRNTFCRQNYRKIALGPPPAVALLERGPPARTG